MLTSSAQERQAWYRTTLSPSDWVVPFPDAAVAECEEVAYALRREPLPTLILSPTQFELTHCRTVMAHVGRQLREGIGLSVIDRLPVERFSLQENQALGWLLGSLLGRLVAQKWDGTMVYDVRDTGKALEYGVRRSVTNLDLQFHTDAPWLDLPPELVGLVCLSPAQEGGLSRFVSLVTVHEELKRRHPALVRRLYDPVPWDRQAEHAPDDAKASRQPVFEKTERGLHCRYNQSLIENGEGLTGDRVDGETHEALEAMRAITDSPELCVEFRIEKGQIQYLNNRLFAHSRTPFHDSNVPGEQRHLIRLWNRDEGRQSFHG